MAVLSAIGVVFLYALTEFLMVRWTLAAVEHEPVRAALSAGAIRALSVAGLLLVVHSPMFAIAAIAGDMFGSYVAVELGPGEEDEDGSEGYGDEDAGGEDP